MRMLVSRGQAAEGRFLKALADPESGASNAKRKQNGPDVEGDEHASARVSYFSIKLM